MTGGQYANEFPQIAHGIVHLNHAGVAPLPRRTADAIRRYAQIGSEGLASFDPEWYPAVERIRATAARFLGSSADEVAFTKSTTHGLIIIALCVPWKKGDCIVVEQSSFPANWYTWKVLEEEHGVRLIEWPEREYGYDPEDLAKILREHPVRMVSASAADYATGFRHDLVKIGKMVKDAGALFCVDAIQVLGAMPLDVEEVRADFLSADAHKWLIGPEGTGLLYVRQSVLPTMKPLMTGWLGRKGYSDYEARNLIPDTTARRFEEGSQSIVGIFGVGASIELLLEVGLETVWQRVQRNRVYLREGLEARGFEVISPREVEKSCGILTVRKAGVDPKVLGPRLVKEKVMCGARRGFLRFSPHFYAEPEILDEALRRLDGVLAG
jgi:cysteine desulfurase/selenocysteine lyase